MICQMCGKKLQDIRHGADAKGFYCPQCSNVRFPEHPNDHREAIIAELEDLKRWVVNPDEIGPEFLGWHGEM